MLERAHPVQTADAVGGPGRAEGQSAEGSSCQSGPRGFCWYMASSFVMVKGSPVDQFAVADGLSASTWTSQALRWTS